jgi:hypothetical protein
MDADQNQDPVWGLAVSQKRAQICLRRQQPFLSSQGRYGKQLTSGKPAMSKQTTSHHKGATPERNAAKLGTRRPVHARQANHAESKVDPQLRHYLVAEAAYYRAEKRGFAPGDEMKDWFEAEAEVDDLLRKQMPSGHH